jgi:hypothetical protein
VCGNGEGGKWKKIPQNLTLCENMLVGIIMMNKKEIRWKQPCPDLGNNLAFSYRYVEVVGKSQYRPSCLRA